MNSDINNIVDDNMIDYINYKREYRIVCIVLIVV